MSEGVGVGVCVPVFVGVEVGLVSEGVGVHVFVLEGVGEEVGVGVGQSAMRLKGIAHLITYPTPVSSVVKG